MITDLCACGVWSPQTDVRVTDTDVPSYVGHPVAAVLAIAEEEKVKYLFAVEVYHAPFTSFQATTGAAHCTFSTIPASSRHSNSLFKASLATNKTGHGL